MVLFWSHHFTFYSSYLGMNYSNVIGAILFLLFILQFLSGLLLSCYYIPFYTIAFDSVYYIMSDVNIGWLIRLVHVFFACLFMLFLFIHFLRGSWIRLNGIECVAALFWPSHLFSFSFHWFYSILVQVNGFCWVIEVSCLLLALTYCFDYWFLIDFGSLIAISIWFHAV